MTHSLDHIGPPGDPIRDRLAEELGDARGEMHTGHTSDWPTGSPPATAIKLMLRPRVRLVRLGGQTVGRGRPQPRQACRDRRDPARPGRQSSRSRPPQGHHAV
jgi:hypothetical protein